MLIRITIRNNIIAGAIFKILSRSFYAEILALQGFPAGLRASYFIRDKAGYPEFRNNQSFSIAGSRGGFDDPRGTLFFELARLAEARKPPYLLFENVPGLLSHDGGRTFATILNTLDRLGYGVEWQCLNSKDFGVPQLSDILMSDVEEEYFLSPKQQEVLLFKPTAVTKENESTPPKD